MHRDISRCSALLSTRLPWGTGDAVRKREITMKKRLLSILLVLIMALSVLPTAAFAEDGGENLPACICETACTAEEMNEGCPVCGAEGAQPENCALYTKVPDMDDPAPEDEDDEAFEEDGTSEDGEASALRSSRRAALPCRRRIPTASAAAASTRAIIPATRT